MSNGEKSKKRDKKSEETSSEQKDDSYLRTYSKNLENKIRVLDAKYQLLKNEKIRLEREVKSIKTELDRMRRPPLLSAIIIKMLKNGRVLTKSSAGPEFFVNYSKNVSPEDLQPGARVAINQRTFQIVEVIKDENNEQRAAYSALKAWQGFDYEVKVIEVQEWREITSDLQTNFYIRVNKLEDLIQIAKYYRIPVIFKKSDEYIGIYYNTPLFWFKP